MGREAWPPLRAGSLKLSEQVEDECGQENHPGADRGSPHHVCEVVDALVHDCNGDRACRQEGDGRKEQAQRRAHPWAPRVDEQYRGCGGQCEYAGGASAGEAQVAHQSPVDEGLEQELLQPPRPPVWRQLRA